MVDRAKLLPGPKQELLPAIDPFSMADSLRDDATRKRILDHMNADHRESVRKHRTEMVLSSYQMLIEALARPLS